MKRFWTEDEFIDSIARNFDPSSQSVYFCLKRHSNKQGHAHIGSSKIAEEMGITPATVLKGLKELRLKGLISERIGNHSFGYYQIYPLPQNLYMSPHHKNEPTQSNYNVVPSNNLTTKELRINIKEKNILLQTSKRTPEEQKHIDESLAKIRSNLETMGLIKKQKV